VAEQDAGPGTTTIAEAVARARATWPKLVIDDVTLQDWLLARVDERTPLDRLHAGDLLLACACARGDATAIASFHAAFVHDLDIVFARSRARGTDVSDLRQLLDVHLFLPDGDRPPRICEYRGAGSLRTWVRVVATRITLNAGRRKSDQDDALTSQMERQLGDVADLELDWLKEHYRGAFRKALGAALAELPATDRSLLRLAVVHGLSATGVAAIYRVHRATAKRWIARVRKTVHDSTRAKLRDALHIDSDELDSIMGLIESRLEASIHRVLGVDGADDVR
jgi:RNA polymerase sigma-70 factor, ECF subfamily